jgi:hypothetical protein
MTIFSSVFSYILMFFRLSSFFLLASGLTIGTIRRAKENHETEAETQEPMQTALTEPKT